MNRLTRYSARIATAAVQTGFTMIELLVVIAILGILAVAVLSAINPIEQINRGRDTGTRSDAEQLLSAIDRYNAFNGWYPWVSTSTSAHVSLPETGTLPQRVDHSWIAYEVDDSTLMGSNSDKTQSGPNGSTGCSVMDRLAGGSGFANCVGTEELKISYVNRVTAASTNGLYIYKQTDDTSSSPYVCFMPTSQAFKNEANARCGVAQADDFPAGACNDTTTPNWTTPIPSGSNTPIASYTDDWICLP